MKYIFETKNLRIRKFETQDAQQLYENHLEEEVKQWSEKAIKREIKKY